MMSAASRVQSANSRRRQVRSRLARRFRLDPPNAAAGRPEPGRQANGPLRDPSRPSVGGRQMIDWLEVARPELSPGPGEVSVVFTGGEPRDPETNGPPPTSDGGSFAAGGRDLDGEPPTDRGTVEERVSAVFTVGGTRNPEKSGSLEIPASRSPADALVSKESDLEYRSALEAATAKTAERGVFDVFAAAAPKGLDNVG